MFSPVLFKKRCNNTDWTTIRTAIINSLSHYYPKFVALQFGITHHFLVPIRQSISTFFRLTDTLFNLRQRRKISMTLLNMSHAKP